jgi:acyl carrier protein
MLRLWDQDALNIAADDNWLRLPRAWNAPPFSALVRTPWIRYTAEDLVPLSRLITEEADAAIVHYISPAKPWRGLLPSGASNDLYKDYLALVFEAELEVDNLVERDRITMADRQQIIDSVTEHLYTVISDAAAGSITENCSLRDFAGFDSLGILETLVWLEATFELTIPDEELVVEHFDSVGKMVDYVVKHRG